MESKDSKVIESGVLLLDRFCVVSVDKATSESIEMDEEEVLKTAMQLEDGNNDDKEMKTEEDEVENDEDNGEG